LTPSRQGRPECPHETYLNGFGETLAAVSPENLETRIVRLETRDEEKARQLSLTVPLIGQVAVMESRVDDFKDDLNEGLKAIRDELTQIKRDQAKAKEHDADRAKERRTMQLALFLAGVGLVGNFLAPLLSGGHP
jgi:uncharacterized phage infection (PIP) family protein YhgE